MSISVEAGGVIASYDYTSLNDDGVLVACGSAEELLLKTPLCLDGSPNPDNYDIYFLIKKDVVENAIYRVVDWESSQRIGWMFPVNSLVSTNHSFSDDEFFLKYAYVAYRKIIETLEAIQDIPIVSVPSLTSEYLEVTDFLHESTVLLIVDNASLPRGVKNVVDCYSPHLLRYGYVKPHNISPEEIQVRAEIIPSERKNLKLKRVSGDIDNYSSIISEVLNGSVAFEARPLFKFFFLYQIVELLIDEIYKLEQGVLIDALVRNRGSSNKVKDLISGLNDVVSEKKRIALLVEVYTQVKGGLHELRDLCNYFLEMSGRDTGSEFQEYFYQVRNFVFHQYRDIPHDAVEVMDDIVSGFIKVLPDILASFSRR